MPANVHVKSSWNLISDTITRITFPSTNGTPFRCYLGGMAAAIELSHEIAEISEEPDKRTCIQIRTPLNSPLLELLKASSHLLCVIEHFKDAAASGLPYFSHNWSLRANCLFLRRIAICTVQASFKNQCQCTYIFVPIYPRNRKSSWTLQSFRTMSLNTKYR